MKKVLKILLCIFLSPLILVGLIYFCVYTLCEAVVVKHTAYFKKNGLKLKGEYYYGILTDPVFKMKNLICKYNLEYEVVSIDEGKTHLVVNQNGECRYIIIDMKNIYCENEKLYFQENTDDGAIVQVDAYLESIKLEKYSYDTSKLLVLKEVVSTKDYEIIANNLTILVIKDLNKKHIML